MKRTGLIELDDKLASNKIHNLRQVCAVSGRVG